jgi:hypothetical protein
MKNILAHIFLMFPSQVKYHSLELLPSLFTQSIFGAIWHYYTQPEGEDGIQKSQRIHIASFTKKSKQSTSSSIVCQQLHDGQLIIISYFGVLARLSRLSIYISYYIMPGV